jgi:hypothetical protein
LLDKLNRIQYPQNFIGIDVNKQLWEVSMFRYAGGFNDIRKMLNIFLRNGIDASKLDPINRVIESAKSDQIKILNSYQSLSARRVFFGATMNIGTVAEVMRERIKVAKEKDENPLTLDLSLELLDILIALAPYVDEFVYEGKITDINRTNELSRLLYRKANSLGFYINTETQLKSAGITKDEAKAFVEKLIENIGLEIETMDDNTDEGRC